MISAISLIDRKPLFSYSLSRCRSCPLPFVGELSKFRRDIHKGSSSRVFLLWKKMTSEIKDVSQVTCGNRKRLQFLRRLLALFKNTTITFGGIRLNDGRVSGPNVTSTLTYFSQSNQLSYNITGTPPSVSVHSPINMYFSSSNGQNTIQSELSYYGNTAMAIIDGALTFTPATDITGVTLPSTGTTVNLSFIAISPSPFVVAALNGTLDSAGIMVITFGFMETGTGQSDFFNFTARWMS